MKKTIILLISIVIIACSSSPDKLMKKGDDFLEKSMIDMAITNYQSIVDNFPEDSLAPRAEYKIAWIELQQKNKYDSGISKLQAIVEKFPENEIGIAASNDLAELPRWLVNKTNNLRSNSTSDKAMQTIEYLLDNYKEDKIVPEALYLKGNIYLNDLKEYYRAINTYQEIIYKYSGNNYEPMSKFMIGFIYANVLNDLTKAEKTYSEFIQEFPEHELVPSVEFELEYLGKQIKDIEDLKTKNN